MSPAALARSGSGAGGLRDAPGLSDLCFAIFRRDVLAFYPQTAIEPTDGHPVQFDHGRGLNFRVTEPPGEPSLLVELFGVEFRLRPRAGAPFTPQDRRMIRAIGAVLCMRYHYLFQFHGATRLELFRGGSEDHYIAAFLEPSAYASPMAQPSRIAATIEALRTAALSTYENKRVSTGALLIGPHADSSHLPRPTPPDALPYGVGLSALKSIHRLCDGTRTLFLVDRAGKLAEIIDVERWAAEIPHDPGRFVPCARAYAAHARATSVGQHVCLVLSPNQEIKLFVGGMQAFAFAHGRWRILDPQTKYAAWETAVASPALARVLFQAALDLAENRQGGLFVVVGHPPAALGRLIAPHDLLAAAPPSAPPAELAPHDPLAKRALHYLARGRIVNELDPPVLEALASLDGALVADRDGRLLAFGAILRHDASALPIPTAAEGARTTAAIAASQFGPVLKVSEDGVISYFLNGARVWDL